MNAIFIIALQEVLTGLRNKWVLSTTLLLGALALSLTLLGSTPTGGVGADSLSVVVVSLSSLSIFLIPLIALMLSFDSIVGEAERGTLLLLMAYPLARWHLIVGKFLGHIFILLLAIVIGYGMAALALALESEAAVELDWSVFGGLILSSILLGGAFLALGTLISTLTVERATAAGLAVASWFVLVLIYDAALLGLLVSAQDGGMNNDLLDLFLLANPADAFRLLNLTSTETVRTLSGMAGLGANSALSSGVLFASLVGWICVPLCIAIGVFLRREP
ncbi:ABC transporter permease subunit [Terasakiella pusilla]|jgi:Cu-processing system permease protein|uniref:ABC transporter permease subunit n=1 Tax=Terasakiella pusilla TaxID=64973 RepID=UPI003AA87DCC